MNQEQMLAKIKMLEEKLALAEKASQRALSMKLTPKGGVSVYGLGRFPVTLYRKQWANLLARKEDILKFIEANSTAIEAIEAQPEVSQEIVG